MKNQKMSHRIRKIEGPAVGINSSRGGVEALKKVYTFVGEAVNRLFKARWTGRW